MGRRPLPKLVWFLLASALLTLIVSRAFLPSAFIDGINCATVARVLLLTSFGLFGLTLLEIAICYIPSLVGAQWALLLLLVGFTLFAGWAARTVSFDGLSATSPQPRSSTLLSRIFSGNHQIAPTLPPRPPRSPSTDPVEPEPNLPPLLPHPAQNPNDPPVNLPPAPAVPKLEQQPGNAEPSYHPAPSPAPAALTLPAITVAQRNAIRDAMKPYAGLRFTLLRVNPTDDSRHYAGQIESALTSAGLIDSSNQDAASDPGNYPAGLSLSIGARQSNAADALSSAMRRAGLVTWAVPISESFGPENFQLIVAPN